MPKVLVLINLRICSLYFAVEDLLEINPSTFPPPASKSGKCFKQILADVGFIKVVSDIFVFS